MVSKVAAAPLSQCSTLVLWRFSEVYCRSVRYRPAPSLAVRTQNAINLVCVQPVHVRHYSIAVYTHIAYITVKL